jgi:hypothetical protein
MFREKSVSVIRVEMELTGFKRTLIITIYKIKLR